MFAHVHFASPYFASVYFPPVEAHGPHGVIVQYGRKHIGDQDRSRVPGRGRRNREVQHPLFLLLLECVQPLVKDDEMAGLVTWAILNEFDDDLADIFLVIED